MSLAQRAAAEALGSAFLLAAVVGSGIMAERLAGGSEGLALLANALATGAALLALIITFAPVSGAHFNPAVSAALAMRGALPWRELPVYAAAQLGGAIAGVMAAQTIFGLPLMEASVKARGGWALGFSEWLATLGLLSVILSGLSSRSAATPYAVALYITGAYWFTASTSFANPAVTLARTLTDSFAGIRAADAPLFLAAQLLAVPAAVVLWRWLAPQPAPVFRDPAAPASALPRSG